MLIIALQNCIESLVNFFGLLLLLYFIFAVCGMSERTVSDAGGSNEL